MMVPQRVVADRGCDEVAGDQDGTLVDQLIEGMLTVGAGLAPYYRTGRPVYRFPVPIHALAVAFHIALLKISGKTVHILIVWQDGFRLRAEEVGIPESDQGHRHRDILFERGRAEMMVGRMRPAQQLLKMVITDGQDDGKTDGAP